MIKTVKQACRFNAAIHDYRMSQGIENLAELIRDEGDGREFFSRNFVTHGMAQLFREGLLRMSGKSDQAVFELTQAMGGGKTHMMIALGLLARHPHLRHEVLPADLKDRIDFGQARIAAPILASAARLVKPGGRLVYATCSLLPAENQHQVTKFLNECDGQFSLIRDQTISPAETGFDGFYMALLQRN